MSDQIHSDVYGFVFDRTATAPLWWYNKASDLHASAGVLWSAGSGGHVYQMLCGMSLELIFKAVIVTNKGKPPRTHDLERLASDAKLKYSKNQLSILKFLTGSIVWSGRYPVPTKKEELEKHYKLGGEILFSSIMPDSKIMRPNDALSWDNYGLIWTKAVDHFIASRNSNKK